MIYLDFVRKSLRASRILLTPPLPYHGVNGGDQGVPLLVDDEEDVTVEYRPHQPNTGLEWPQLGKLVLISRWLKFSKN